MASLSVSLSNLLRSLSNQYTVASNKKTETNISPATSSSTPVKESGAVDLTSSNVKSASNTGAANSANNTNTKYAAETTTASSLSKLLSSLSKSSNTLNNITVITNDTVTEFFKSYKNSTMTAIYNKIQTGSAMTQTDLANFRSQVSKLSTDEQKLWKSEIAKIENQITEKIPAAANSTNTNNNTNSNSGSNANTNAKPNTSTNNTTVLNGFVSGVLYQNGSKYTGIYTDGKYYNNGVLATATVNGKYYYNGVLANGTINGKSYENGVEKVVATPTPTASTTAPTPTATPTPATANTSSKDLTVATKNTDSNGNVFGYNASGKLVYMEKNVNGKKVVYTDELLYLNSKTLSNLKSIDDALISDRMLSDIQIVKNAEAAGLKAGAEGSSAYKTAYDASIKSQMIKTTSNMTGAAGEVVEKNGSLYVNDGGQLVKLNISAETYLNLFPPVDRYDINQNNIGDCYFVSGCLTDMMKNGSTYAKLLQMFSEDSQGNITVKFAGSLGSYPVTFENGELKAVDGKVDGRSVSRYYLAAGSLGTQMLEEAYAISKFSRDSKKSVTSIDIDETFEPLDKGLQHNVYEEVLGIKNANRDRITVSNLNSYLNSMASKVNSGSVMLSFASYGNASEYGITDYHAYSIEKIDSANKMVYISNPWYGGDVIAVPYSDFAKIAYSEYNMTYFSYGYLNS